ncbi:DUF4435 domain-containing protein [Tenacibaculum finnmarkense]|uniref:DUF4435 domain-containing protein n=1 Tax=Tenacibaculum finnmarkense TaxID=2781243 RepID=UPI001E4902E0|nr:DUF4435 domain-containing protein [Tenacibaculum finnmarkense]MCD8413646.1 DUF4435 domain-containing protein [Tenacibaculum finnmarkense genomovar ulcerans]WBX67865.1 DUF4435 domain-containing protein [Tenacibaculum dicentrarchi]
MSFLQSLKDAGTSPITTHIRFLQEYKLTDKALHLFIEGNDDPSFYTNFIKNIAGKKYQLYFYNSKNKDGVYENYNKIDWTTYHKNKVLFFVDKDFSDVLGLTYTSDENIFVTKYYSIENYLVNTKILKRILVDLLHITDTDTIKGIVKTFKEQHKVFCKQMLILTSWIIYHRSKKNNIPLSKVNLSHIFSFDEDLKITRIDKPQGMKLYSYLNSKTGNTDNSESWKEIKSIFKKIKVIRKDKIHLRGKFEVWFLIAFVNELMENVNATKSKGQQKLKMNINLSKSNAVEILGSRLDVPKELKKFVKFNIAK